ncbi:MAG: hypothetical protein A4S09_11045 [Proteobacteria bacterium SG_bin7]|nr:MAG: hypothetical protein A4S09_11045 [Proteobacteria bacterium SG_bin7]
MNIAKLGKTLIAIAIFLFTVSSAIYFGKKYSQRGQIDKNNVFCLACLEGHYYKTKTWKYPLDLNFAKWSELVFIPSEVSISERALLAKILTNFSNVAAQERFRSEPLAQWADRFFRAWGRTRPQLKIRIPYFARIQNSLPDWPSEPQRDFFGAVLSGPSTDPHALILVSSTQTEFDATLSVAHGLFRLFDPAGASTQLDFSPELKNYWLEFRAFICEIELWHLFNRFFEPPTLSYYHYQTYPQLWQKIKNKNYLDIFNWVIEKNLKSIPLQNISAFQVLPLAQGKMQVEKMEANFEIATIPEALAQFSWFKYLKLESPYEGILLAIHFSNESQNSQPKDATLFHLTRAMKEFIFKSDKNFNSDDPQVIFSKFHEYLGENGVTLPKTLTENFNFNVRGEF